MIYQINKLLEFDLNNSKDIKMEFIINSLKIEYEENNTDDFMKKVNQLYCKFNESRKKTFERYFIDFLKRQLKNENRENRENKEKILLELIKNILLPELVKEVGKRCLPMEDKNISNTEKQLEELLRLSIILRRMGKIEEAKSLINIKENIKKDEVIYTFTSYVKEWKNKKKEQYKFIDDKKLNDILEDVIEEARNFNSNEKIKEIANIHKKDIHKKDRKYYENYAIIKGAEFFDNIKIFIETPEQIKSTK